MPTISNWAAGKGPIDQRPVSGSLGQALSAVAASARAHHLPCPADGNRMRSMQSPRACGVLTERRTVSTHPTPARSVLRGTQDSEHGFRWAPDGGAVVLQHDRALDQDGMFDHGRDQLFSRQ